MSLALDGAAGSSDLSNLSSVTSNDRHVRGSSNPATSSGLKSTTVKIQRPSS
jgi:hypothetical protein